MKNKTSFRVAQELSNLPKILWFEIDEILIFVMPVTVLSIMQVNMVLSVIYSGAVAYIFRNAKKNSARGYFFHLAYIWGISKFDEFESVRVKEYKE